MGKVASGRLTRLLNEVEQVIAFDQPYLVARLERGRVVVAGRFMVTSTVENFRGQGSIASYEVRIELSPGFPRVEPEVWETGGAISRDHEFHINADGSCCVLVWEAWLTTAPEISVQAFFDGPLKSFFLSQHVRQTTGMWPFGEWEHGKVGLLQAFADRLGCRSEEGNVVYLLRLLLRSWPRGHRTCPCGSGKLIRKCCSKSLATLSHKVRPEEARQMLERLEHYKRKRKGGRSLRRMRQLHPGAQRHLPDMDAG